MHDSGNRSALQELSDLGRGCSFPTRLDERWAGPGD